MKRPAIFFDRDNTLIASDGYLGDPEKVVLMEGAAEAVARARALGFATVVISNQSGVARGMFSEDDVDAVNHKMDEVLRAAHSSAVIDRHEFCPFHPEATVELYRQESDQRKPKPGMILSAAQKLALDLSRSWVIGDAPRDIEAGQAAGCRTILLQPSGVAQSPAIQEPINLPPDSVAPDLKQAMDFVAANLNGQSSPAPASRPTAIPVQPALTSRLEQIAEHILLELRRQNDQQGLSEFSVSKLMAGMAQVTALAVLFLAYLNRSVTESHYALIFFAIFLQTLTIALLIMGKQK